MSAGDTLPLADWVENNLRRAQGILDGRPEPVDQLAPLEAAVALALLSIAGVMLMPREHDAEPGPEWERLARESAPATGPGIAVRKPCGCVVDWVAKSASDLYRDVAFKSWLERGGMTFEPMDYDAAAPLLVSGRGCTHT